MSFHIQEIVNHQLQYACILLGISNIKVTKEISSFQFSLVSCVWLFVTPWTAACQASLSLTISHSLPKLMFIASVMPSSHLILWCLFSFCPQSLPASGTFPMSCLFISDDQNTGASASGSVLPVNIQGWSPLRLIGLISLFSRDFQESPPAPQFEDTNSLAFCLHNSIS